MSVIPGYDLLDKEESETVSMLNSVSSRIREFIEENPASALAFALVGGVVVGWVLKRQ
ncbi:hypothetical protein K2Y11_24970 [bacterium]|nr:hypothetical protein [bacterium]